MTGFKNKQDKIWEHYVITILTMGEKYHMLF